MTDALLEQIESELKKVTPGPWRVEENRRQNVETVRGLAICYLGQNSMAGDGYYQQITTDEAEANARFVAHAPEWLQALVGRLRQSEQERDQATHDAESGFAPGAYARLHNLQQAEREMYALREQVTAFRSALQELRGVVNNVVAIPGEPRDRDTFFASPDACKRALLEAQKIIEQTLGVGSPTGAPQP